MRVGEAVDAVMAGGFPELRGKAGDFTGAPLDGLIQRKVSSWPRRDA
jgi:hypothetical protein